MMLSYLFEDFSVIGSLEKYRSFLAKTVIYWGGSIEDAEDIVQDIFIKAINGKFPQADNENSLAKLMETAAINEVINRKRLKYNSSRINGFDLDVPIKRTDRNDDIGIIGEIIDEVLGKLNIAGSAGLKVKEWLLDGMGSSSLARDLWPNVPMSIGKVRLSRLKSKIVNMLKSDSRLKSLVES